MRVTKITTAIAVVFLTATSILAQDRKQVSRDEQSKYVISAKAGVVSVTEGEVSITRFRPFAIPEALLWDDELALNDKVRTGANGRVEILLNPGCYLRMDENSEIVYLFDGFDSNRIKLLRGSAIIEATVLDGLIFVETPNTKFDVVREGLYRFNVGADGKSELAVRKGRVLVGDTEIKEGKRAVAEESTALVAAFNKKDPGDAFDNWSKQRAQTLIAANKSLSKKDMRRSLGTSYLYNAWIYDPFCRCYTFLPFGSGFGSPYGWNYAVCNPYWYYATPRYNGWPGGGWSGGNGSGGSGGGGGHPGSGGGSGGGHSAPPMPTNGGGSGVVHNPSGSDRGLPSGGHERPAKP